MSTNRLKRMWEAGETAFGAWCSMPTSLSAEVLSREEVDYVGVDCQHGLIDYSGLVPMLQAISTSTATPVVRVPSNDSAWIGKVLDAGAEAVIVPMVNSKAEAERAVTACRYAPRGTRSFGPVRAGLYLGLDPHVVNEEVLCLVMIETREAVERADEICSTPGLDGVYIGPADLSISMGLRNLGADSRDHAEAIERVRTTCERHKLIVGIHTSSGEQARRYAAAGFRMMSLASDIALLRAAIRDQLAVARSGRDQKNEAAIGEI